MADNETMMAETGAPGAASEGRGGGRIQSLDALKLLAIFLVLWGHCLLEMTTTDSSYDPMFRFISSFHMPLFMMIAGFFYYYTFRPGFLRNVWHKFRQVLLPLVCWTVIFEVYLWYVYRHDEPAHLIHALHYGLWFLKSLFVCCMLGYFVYAPGRMWLRWTMLVLTLAVSQLIGLSTWMYPCFLAGGAVCILRGQMLRHLWWVLGVSGVLFAATLCFFDAETMQVADDHFSRKLIFTEPGAVALYRLQRDVTGIAGGLFFIALFELLFATPRRGRFALWACRWGKLTLGIYILQTLLLEFMLTRWVKFDGMNYLLFTFVVAPLISMAVMALSVGIIRLIQRSRVASFLLLGSRWKN